MNEPSGITHLYDEAKEADAVFACGVSFFGEAYTNFDPASGPPSTDNPYAVDCRKCKRTDLYRRLKQDADDAKVLADTTTEFHELVDKAIAGNMQAGSLFREGAAEDLFKAFIKIAEDWS